MSLVTIQGILVLIGALVISFIISICISYYLLKIWNCFCEAGKLNIFVNINLTSVMSLSVFLLLLESIPNLSELFILG